MKKTIFVVDHDPSFSDGLARELQAVGYDVLLFPTGRDAEEAIETVDVDLVVIDPALPDMDGLDLVRHIRTKPRVGIIVLAAHTHVADRIIGLEMGADDYIGKASHVRELVARVRTVLRRVERSGGGSSPEPADTQIRYEFDGWRLNTSNFTVTRPDGRDVSLTTGEFRILEFLVTHPNRFWTAQQLSHLLPSKHPPIRLNTVMTSVKRLRRRLGDSARESKLIQTLRGSGYKFRPKVARIVEIEAKAPASMRSSAPHCDNQA